MEFYTSNITPEIAVKKLIALGFRPIATVGKRPVGKTWTHLSEEEAIKRATAGASNETVGWRPAPGTVIVDLDDDKECVPNHKTAREKRNILLQEYPQAANCIVHKSPHGLHYFFKSSAVIQQTQRRMCKLGFHVDLRVPEYTDENGVVNLGGQVILYPSEMPKREFQGDDLIKIQSIDELPEYPADKFAKLEAPQQPKKATIQAKPVSNGTSCGIIEHFISDPSALSALQAGKGMAHRFVFQILSMLFQYPANVRADKYQALVSAMTTAGIDQSHIESLDKLEGKIPSCGSMVAYCKEIGLAHSDLCRGCSLRESYAKATKDTCPDFSVYKTYSDFKEAMKNYKHIFPNRECPMLAIREEIYRRFKQEYNVQTDEQTMILSRPGVPQFRRFGAFNISLLQKMMIDDFPIMSSKSALTSMATEFPKVAAVENVTYKITKTINTQNAILMADNKVLEYDMSIRELRDTDIFINRISSAYENVLSISSAEKAIIDQCISNYENDQMDKILASFLRLSMPKNKEQFFIGMVGRNVDALGNETNAGFGKSQFIQLLLRVFGEDNMIISKIEEFGKQFKDARFVTAMIVYCDEFNDKRESHAAIGEIKEFANESEPIPLEMKHKQDRLYYINNAGIALSTNHPRALCSETDQGSHRRYRACAFVKQFTSNTIPFAQRLESQKQYDAALNVLERSQSARNYFFTKMVNAVRDCIAAGVSTEPTNSEEFKIETALTDNENVLTSVLNDHLAWDANMNPRDMLSASDVLSRLKNAKVYLGVDNLKKFSKVLSRFVESVGTEATAIFSSRSTGTRRFKCKLMYGMNNHNVLNRGNLSREIINDKLYPSNYASLAEAYKIAMAANNAGSQAVITPMPRTQNMAHATDSVMQDLNELMFGEEGAPLA